MTPTDEQEAIAVMFANGKHTAVEAYAGTGKTSTLELLALVRPDLRMQYVAFNKAVVTEAQARFPANVTASTAHSMAYRVAAQGQQGKRLQWPRQRPTELAKLLGCERYVVPTAAGPKTMGAAWFASMAVKTVRQFCTTGDGVLSRKHVAWPGAMMGADGPVADLWGPVRTELAPLVVDYARAAWADVCSPTGRLRWEHNYYLKQWQLMEPRIHADVVLYDEAQDANGVMLAVVEAQRDHAQLVYVGDRHQQVYAWNGAVNAMDSMEVDQRAWLTGSFRFGERIAAEANRVLVDVLGADLGVRGLNPLNGRVGYLDAPDVVLARTNWGVLSEVIAGLANGTKVYVVGGVDDLVHFMLAAQDLQRGKETQHPELSCFESWAEVVAYAAEDQLGDDLALAVRLVEEHGTSTLLYALKGVAAEADAQLVVSTAHKAKGREWDRVRLRDDFRQPAYDLVSGELVNGEEQRLLYVAMTRARSALDVTEVEQLTRPTQTTLQQQLGSGS